MKVEDAVRLETKRIAAGTVILSVVMEAVYLLGGWWDYTVLLGNLLGAAGAVLNFFLMGLTIQQAAQEDQKKASNLIKLSQLLRLLMLFVVAIVGVCLPCFDMWAALIPLFFPRLVIPAIQYVEKRKGEKRIERTTKVPVERCPSDCYDDPSHSGRHVAENMHCSGRGGNSDLRRTGIFHRSDAASGFTDYRIAGQFLACHFIGAGAVFVSDPWCYQPV